jgi:hypothetical protein
VNGWCTGEREQFHTFLRSSLFKTNHESYVWTCCVESSLAVANTLEQVNGGALGEWPLQF